MPFTTVSNVSLNQGNGNPDPYYFHPDDTNIILGQFGANGTTILKIIFDGKECYGQLGVNVDENNTVTVLNQPQHFVALACPPFNDAGGVFYPG